MTLRGTHPYFCQYVTPFPSHQYCGWCQNKGPHTYSATRHTPQLYQDLRVELLKSSNSPTFGYSEWQSTFLQLSTMIFILLLIAIPLASNAAAQAAVTSFTLPDPNVCHGGYGLTTFKACNLYASSLQLCESSRECYCKPEVLSAVYK